MKIDKYLILGINDSSMALCKSKKMRMRNLLLSMELYERFCGLSLFALE